jgi:hypothetical protein
MKKNLLIIIIFTNLKILSQHIPISYLWYEKEKATNSFQTFDSLIHTGWFPYVFLDVKIDSLTQYNILEVKQTNNSFLKKFYNKSFFQVKDDEFVLHINPLINFEKNSSISSVLLSENTRGLIIYGQLSNRFRFVTGATETQAFYQDYINKYRINNLVIPGGGRARPFKQNGFDFSKSFGYIIFSFNKKWHLLFGHNKQFTGYGYRSVLLSDAPFEFPNMQVRYTNKLIQYIVTYATFQSASAFDNNFKVFSRKFSSIHYLSLKPHKNFELGLYENTIFQSMSNYKNRPPEEYYIPLIYSHYLIYGLNNKNNVMLGFQAQYCIFSFLKIYSQLAIDDYKDSTLKKIAWQIGTKISEPFGFKNLFILSEYNKAFPNTYAGYNELSDFSQQNESIAHILGNDFNEYVLSAYYKYKIWYLFFKYNVAEYSNVKIFQPSIQKNKVKQYKIESGILLNKMSRLYLTCGYNKRIANGSYIHFFFISLKTQFFNFYDDF